MRRNPLHWGCVLMKKPMIITGESSPQQVALLASLALPTAPYGPWHSSLSETSILWSLKPIYSFGYNKEVAVVLLKPNGMTCTGCGCHIVWQTALLALAAPPRLCSLQLLLPTLSILAIFCYIHRVEDSATLPVITMQPAITFIYSTSTGIANFFLDAIST